MTDEDLDEEASIPDQITKLEHLRSCFPQVSKA